MALTKSMLTGMKLEDDQVDAILAGHRESLDAIRAEGEKYRLEAERYKADADKVAGLEKELKALKDAADGEDWKARYEAEKEAFESYKTEQSARETTKQIEKALKGLCEEIGISKTAIDNVVAVTDTKSLAMTKDGALKDAEKLAESLKTKWSGFITTTQTTGANTQTPPANNNSGGKMSYDEINKIKDASKRQEAIAANLDTYMRGE